MTSCNCDLRISHARTPRKAMIRKAGLGTLRFCSGGSYGRDSAATQPRCDAGSSATLGG